MYCVPRRPKIGLMTRLASAPPPRRAELSRTTRETEISLSLDLDGAGKADIQTGIGFFDHMLESFAKHGAFDLTVRAKGDLHVDMHHTVEDVGIVLGQAFKAALAGPAGTFAGIVRFGHFYAPMDETLSRAAVDLCNRPYLVWRVRLERPKLGEMDTELFKEWFHAFAMNAGICAHIENLYGENTHHIVESCFKALARALRMAIAREDRLIGAASTKGSL